MNYEDLLSFAITPQEKELLQCIISEGSQTKGFEKFGRNKRNCQRSIKRIRDRAIKQGYSPDHNMTHPFPMGIELERITMQYGKNGEVERCWPKGKVSQENIEEQINNIVEALHIPKFKPVKSPKILADDMMNVYVFGDPHIDALSWLEETGHNWDLDIAIHNHISAMTDMISRSPKCNIGILATMGDLFHRDSLKAITPGSGNLVDVDGRLGRSYDHGVVMIRAMIDKMLKKYQEVKYVCVRGNHSPTLELLLSKTIKIAYENEPRVEVIDNTPREISYSYENNFLLFVHGDGLNDQKKSGIVTSKYRKQHGDAKFSHVLSAHLHHEYKKEVNGVLVEIFPVLPYPDAWHCENGYLTSDQSASVVTYSKYGGISDRTTTNPRIFLQEKR